MSALPPKADIPLPGSEPRFHKRHNLDITASLIALHGVGVGGYDRVCPRDVYHCEAARL
jgi:hypothetical protein